MLFMAVKVANRHCLVVGGGAIAERRVQTFLKEGAHIRLVSPKVTARLAELARNNKIEWQKRTYAADVLAGADYVLALTDNREVNRQCVKDAKALGCLVNCGDDKDQCDFMLPSTADFTQLDIAIRSRGASPRINKLLRQDIEERYAPVDQMLVELADLRQLVKDRLETPKERHAFWQSQFTRESLRRVIQGQWIDVKEDLLHAISSIGIKS